MATAETQTWCGLMSSKYESREDVAGKIEWEGFFYALEEGYLKPEDMPDPELAEAAEVMQQDYEQLHDSMAVFEGLLPDG